jgi:LysR family hca operon transcriptional activator
VFLDHARIALLQIEAAREAARRAAAPAKATFALGFLTGSEMDWLPPVMALLRDELPSTEVVIHSQSSPELAAGLMRGARPVAGLQRGERVAAAEGAAVEGRGVEVSRGADAYHIAAGGFGAHPG